MSVISLFGPYLPSSFSYLISNLDHAFIGCILHQHHSDVVPPIDIDEAAHVAGLIGHKLPKNELSIEICIFLEHLPASPHNIVRDRRPVLFRQRLQKLEQLVDPQRDVVVDEPFPRGGPGGQHELPAGAEGF